MDWALLAIISRESGAKMNYRKDDLGITLYAPVLESGDSRPVDIVHAMERALASVRLEWTVSNKRQLTLRTDRDAWLSQPRTDGEFPLVCNNDPHRPVMISGWTRPAMPGPNGHALLEVHAEMPLGERDFVEDVLESIAEGARAVWGHASPKGLGAEVAQQMRHSVHGPEHSPRGLPMLKLPWHMPSYASPYHLGWVNYWSAAAAQTMGFPDASRDADLLTHARRAATGGWVVRLTDTPLDLDNSTHLNTLLRIYERFPGIGGRSTP